MKTRCMALRQYQRPVAGLLERGRHDQRNDDRDSDMEGGAPYHDNRVRVERIRQKVI